MKERLIQKYYAPDMYELEKEVDMPIRNIENQKLISETSSLPQEKAPSTDTPISENDIQTKS
jgi:hypothetical protein